MFLAYVFYFRQSDLVIVLTGLVFATLSRFYELRTSFIFSGTFMNDGLISGHTELLYVHSLCLEGLNLTYGMSEIATHAVSECGNT